MNDVLTTADAWLARGDRVALATVVAVRRSAARPVGAKMAVNERGEVVGAVSGGCVEVAVVGEAEGVLDGGAPCLLRFGTVDGDAWEVGLPCGGEIDVWVERHRPSAFGDIVRRNQRGVWVTMLRGPAPGAKLVVGPEGIQQGSLASSDLDARASVRALELMWRDRSELSELSELSEDGGVTLFFDVAAPPPRLVIVGAVEYASYLCTFARTSGWQPYVVDPRGRFAAGSFPDATEVIASWPAPALRRLGLDRATAVAVLSHDAKIDDDALFVALPSDAAYVGAIGSRRADQARRQRLLGAGLHPAVLDKLSGPIGLDLGAHSAQGTALSIMAEIVAVYHGHDGGRLSQTTRARIHSTGRPVTTVHR